MASKFKVLPEMELVVVAYSGRVERSDLADLWAAVVQAPGYGPAFDSLLVNGPTVDSSGIDYQETREHALKVADERAELFQVPKRFACLCAYDEQIAMMRLYTAYTQTRGPSQLHIEWFMDLDRALCWLEESKPHRTLDRDEVRTTLAEMGETWCLRGRAVA